MKKTHWSEPAIRSKKKEKLLKANAGSNGFDRIKHRTFWRDSLEDRKRTDTEALNIFGNVVSQSYFPGTPTLWIGNETYVYGEATIGEVWDMLIIQ